MTIEILLWIMGITIPAGLAWAFAVMWLLRDLKKNADATYQMCAQLLEMHQNPDKYGIGIGPAEKKLDDIHTALQALVHYVRWSAKETSGREPPPPMT